MYSTLIITLLNAPFLIFIPLWGLEKIVILDHSAYQEFDRKKQQCNMIQSN